MRNNGIKKYLIGFALACIACVCCILGFSRPTSIPQAKAATVAVDSSKFSMGVTWGGSGRCSYIYSKSSTGATGPGVKFRVNLSSDFYNEYTNGALTYTSGVTGYYVKDPLSLVTKISSYRYSVTGYSLVATRDIQAYSACKNGDFNILTYGAVSEWVDTFSSAVYFSGSQQLSFTVGFGSVLAPTSYDDSLYYFLVVCKKEYKFSLKNLKLLVPGAELPTVSDLNENMSDYDLSATETIEAITSNYYECDMQSEAEYFLRNSTTPYSDEATLKKYWAVCDKMVTDDDAVPITINYQQWDSNTNNAFLKNVTKTIYIQKYYCLSASAVKEKLIEACSNGLTDFNINVSAGIPQISGSGSVYANGETFTYRSAKDFKSYDLSTTGGSVTVDYGDFAPENALLQCRFYIRLYSSSNPNGSLSNITLFLRPIVENGAVKFKRDGIATYLSNSYNSLSFIDMTQASVKSLGSVIVSKSSAELALSGFTSDSLASCRCFLSLSLEDDTYKRLKINYTTFTIDDNGNVTEVPVTKTLKDGIWRSIFYKINKSALEANAYSFDQNVLDNVLASGKVKLSDGSYIDYATIKDVSRGAASSLSSEFVLTVEYTKHSFFRFIDDVGASKTARYEAVPSDNGEFATFLAGNYIIDLDGFEVCGIKSGNVALATVTQAAALTDYSNYMINVKCKLNDGAIIPIIIEYGEYINLKLIYFADITFEDDTPTGFASQVTKFAQAGEMKFKKNDFSGYDTRSITLNEFEIVLEKLEVNDIFNKDYLNDENIAELNLDDEGVLCITPNYLPMSIVDNESNVLAEIGITRLLDWEDAFTQYGLTQDIKLKEGVNASHDKIYGYFYAVGLNLEVTDSETFFAGYKVPNDSKLAGRCAIGKCDVAVFYDYLMNNKSYGTAITGIWNKSDNSGFKYTLKGEKPEGADSFSTYLCYIDGTKTNGECSVSDNIDFTKNDESEGGEGGGGSSGENSSSGGGKDSSSSSSGSDSFEDFMNEFDFKKAAVIAGGCIVGVALVMSVIYALPQISSGVKGFKDEDLFGDTNEE